MTRKRAPPTPVGETVIVDKQHIKPPPEPSISASYYELKVRPKKALSEKQQENLAKLIERNKARAVERREVVKDVIPESIPEDKVLVRIRPKRVYNRKPKEEPKEPESERELKEPKNSVIFPSDTEEASESEPEPAPKPRRARKQAPKAPIKPRYAYDTETTTADEDSDSDDDYKVDKYAAKAQKRIQAVEKIDQRLQQLRTNPYQSRGMSVF